MDDRRRPARAGGGRATGGRRARARGARRRPLRPVLRLRGAPGALCTRGSRAAPGRGRVARLDLPRRAGREPGRARRVLVQREQDHHDERRRDAGLGERELGRARAKALDAGARAGPALRARRDRLQLSDEQPARRASGGLSSRRCPSVSRPGGGSATGTPSSSTCRGSPSCPRRRTGRRTPG